MPKLKVRKAAKKRYKQVGPKKFMRKSAFKGHMLEKKSTKQKRSLNRAQLVTPGDVQAIRRMLVS